MSFPHTVRKDACDIPVFCPADAAVPETTQDLADYVRIDISNPDGRRTALSMLPHFGPAWYHKATVAFLLGAGIATWSDSLLSFSASTHRPADFLAEKLEAIEDIWLLVGGGFVGQ